MKVSMVRASGSPKFDKQCVWVVEGESGLPLRTFITLAAATMFAGDHKGNKVVRYVRENEK